MNKRIIACLGIVTLLFTTTPVYATQIEEAEIIEGTQDAVTDFYEAADEQTIVSAVTQEDEENPACVSVSFEIPTGFGYDAYVEFKEIETEQVYQISAKDVNSYTSRGYVPYGVYKVISKGIVGDLKGEYLFTAKSEDMFTLSEETKSASIVLRMDKYDEVLATINEYNKSQEESEPVESETTTFATYFGSHATYPTALDGVYMDDACTLYYLCDKDSELGNMYVTGNSIQDYDIVVTIIKEGVIGEAQFSISLDGGETIIGTDVVQDTVKISSIGIALYFSTADDNDMFMEGDTFSVSLPATFQTHQSSGEPKNMNVIICGSPIEDNEILINILSSGSLGQAKYTLSLDKGVTTVITDVLPEDGILEYGAYTFYFSDGVYQKGNEISCSIESRVETINYVPIIVCGFVLFCGIVIAYMFFAMKKEKPLSYRLNPWTDYQSPDKYE